MKLDALIYALEDLLDQERVLLGVLSREQYVAPAKGRFSSSVGMHIRHNLDHFAAFFDGLTSREIDYESRERNVDVEQVPAVAIGLIEQFIGRLNELRGASDAALNIREESDANPEGTAQLPSSIGRELQFLLGHTVHHHALIVLLLDGQGVELPAGFGIAPSTQRYHAKAAVASA